MKHIPDLTDEEFATACKCMDIALRATGLEFVQPIAALDRKLAKAQDVPDPDPEAPKDASHAP